MLHVANKTEISGSSIRQEERENVHYKLEYVTKWLNSFYDKAPPFEENEQSVDLLYRLAKTNRAQNRILDLNKEVYQKLTSSYEEKEIKTQETLVNFGLSLDMLSYEAGEYISKFVSIAMSLSFEDLSETTLVTGLQQMSENLINSTIKLQELKMEKNKQKKILQCAEKKQQHLQRSAEKIKTEYEVKNQILDSQKMEYEFYSLKINEYKEDSRSFMNKLKENGYSENIHEYDSPFSHSAILALEKNVANAKDKLIPLQKKIDAYHHLPTDISLAKIALQNLEEKMEELQRLVHQVDFDC